MTILHEIGDGIRGVLLEVPLPVVRALFVISLLVVLIWVLRLPRSETTPEDGSGRWDENLKAVAGVALGIQILVYFWF